MNALEKAAEILASRPLMEPERRVLRGQGQRGCSLCEEAAKTLGVDLPEAHQHP